MSLDPGQIVNSDHGIPRKVVHIAFRGMRGIDLLRTTWAGTAAFRDQASPLADQEYFA